MARNFKCMEIKEEFYVVYSVSDLEEAKNAQKMGHGVLIERIQENGTILLDDIQKVEYDMSRSTVGQ